MKFSIYANALGDLLWPPRCIGCGSKISSGNSPDPYKAFCPVCVDSLVASSSPKCSRCALPFEGTGQDHICIGCHQKPPPFNRVIAPMLYGGALADAIVRFKYGDSPHLARHLAKFILAAFEKTAVTADVIVPVPLHPRRLRRRGFNQSALLAGHIAAVSHISHQPQFIERIRETTSQAGLSRSDRRTNLKGAFQVTAGVAIKKKRVLLVDDVITTGSTIRETARVLKRAGAASIEVVALARAFDSLAPGVQKR